MQRGRPRREAGEPVRRRVSERIEKTEAIEFTHALHFARDLDREPNLHVVVQWGHAPCDRPPAERVTRLMNLIGNWSRRVARLPPVWCYVREVGRLKGEHVHILAHVPPALISVFRARLQDWVAGEATGEVLRSAVRVDPIRPGDVQLNLKPYLLKEAGAEVRQLWAVPSRHKRTGLVIEGRRVRVAHAIGRAARLAAGWRQPADASSAVSKSPFRKSEFGSEASP